MARASVTKRGKMWRWRQPYTDSVGKRHWVSGTERTKAEAESRAAEAARQIDDGLSPLDARMKLAEFVTDHWLPAIRPTVGHRTLRGYESNLRLHILPNLGEVELRKLTPPAVQKLYRKKIEQGLAPRSIRQIHATLHAVLGKALKWNMVTRNVADAVDLPRLERYDAQVLNEDGVRSLLEAARGSRLESPVVLALAGGLRTGEVLGLTWEHVDLDRAQVQVVQTLQRRQGQGLVIGDTKTHRSRRPIDLPPSALGILRAWKREQAAERLAAGPAWNQGDWVCTHSDGRPISPEELSHLFKELIAKAGLPPMRFYDLRHSHATLLALRGVHAKVMSERLGHSQISTTMNTYTHVLPTMGREAALAIDSLFDQEASPRDQNVTSGNKKAPRR